MDFITKNKKSTSILIGKFQCLKTKEIYYEVIGVNRVFQVYNASKYKLLEEFLIDNIDKFSHNNYENENNR